MKHLDTQINISITPSELITRIEDFKKECERFQIEEITKKWIDGDFSEKFKNDPKYPCVRTGVDLGNGISLVFHWKPKYENNLLVNL